MFSSALVRTAYLQYLMYLPNRDIATFCTYLTFTEGLCAMRTPVRALTVTFTVLVMVAATLSSAAFFLQVPVGAQLSANMPAPYVQGTIDLGNPGGEGFWSTLTGAVIPLTATNSYGGNTKSILVKMANNGTDILVYATWTDPTESRNAKSIIEDPAFPGLFKANSTYFYEDRIVFWWSLDQTVGPPPCMQKSAYGHGEGESLAGTGNLWHWKAARTDSLGTVYGKLKYGSGPDKGKALIPPHSYADNEFIDATGHYQLGWDQYPTASVPGNFTIGEGENNIPYNTFVVSAHGVYDSSAHTWKWVAARKLTTTPSLHVEQFAPGRVYYFAVAVYDGGPIPIPQTVASPPGLTMYGENGETKSISTWYTMALGAAATSSSTTGAGGVSFETAAVVSLGMLIVGFVAGLLVISKFAFPKRKR
jgi:hypothetical protein